MKKSCMTIEVAILNMRWKEGGGRSSCWRHNILKTIERLE